MSSNCPPQLHLTLPANTTSFKRSFEQFGFDLESPTHAGEALGSAGGSSSAGSSTGNDRNKRARSASNSFSDEGDSHSSGQASGSQSSALSALSATRPLEPTASSSLVPPRLPTPDIQDIEMSDLETEVAPDYPEVAPSLPPIVRSDSPIGSERDEQYRLTIERFNAFDTHIAALRSPARSPTPPPTLPPISLSEDPVNSSQSTLFLEPPTQPSEPHYTFGLPRQPAEDLRPSSRNDELQSIRDRLSSALDVIRAPSPLLDLEASSPLASSSSAALEAASSSSAAAASSSSIQPAPTHTPASALRQLHRREMLTLPWVTDFSTRSNRMSTNYDSRTNTNSRLDSALRRQSSFSSLNREWSQMIAGESAGPARERDAIARVRDPSGLLDEEAFWGEEGEDGEEDDYLESGLVDPRETRGSQLNSTSLSSYPSSWTESYYHLDRGADTNSNNNGPDLLGEIRGMSELRELSDSERIYRLSMAGRREQQQSTTHLHSRRFPAPAPQIPPLSHIPQASQSQIPSLSQVSPLSSGSHPSSISQLPHLRRLRSRLYGPRVGASTSLMSENAAEMRRWNARAELSARSSQTGYAGVIGDPRGSAARRQASRDAERRELDRAEYRANLRLEARRHAERRAGAAREAEQARAYLPMPQILGLSGFRRGLPVDDDDIDDEDDDEDEEGIVIDVEGDGVEDDDEDVEDRDGRHAATSSRSPVIPPLPLLLSSRNLDDDDSFFGFIPHSAGSAAQHQHLHSTSGSGGTGRRNDSNANVNTSSNTNATTATSGSSSSTSSTSYSSAASRLTDMMMDPILVESSTLNRHTSFPPRVSVPIHRPSGGGRDASVGAGSSLFRSSSLSPGRENARERSRDRDLESRRGRVRDREIPPSFSRAEHNASTPWIIAADREWAYGSRRWSPPWAAAATRAREGSSSQGVSPAERGDSPIRRGFFDSQQSTLEDVARTIMEHPLNRRDRTGDREERQDRDAHAQLSARASREDGVTRIRDEIDTLFSTSTPSSARASRASFDHSLANVSSTRAAAGDYAEPPLIPPPDLGRGFVPEFEAVEVDGGMEFHPLAEGNNRTMYMTRTSALDEAGSFSGYLSYVPPHAPRQANSGFMQALPDGDTRDVGEQVSGAGSGSGGDPRSTNASASRRRGIEELYAPGPFRNTMQRIRSLHEASHPPSIPPLAFDSDDEFTDRFRSGTLRQRGHVDLTRDSVSSRHERDSQTNLQRGHFALSPYEDETAYAEEVRHRPSLPQAARTSSPPHPWGDFQRSRVPSPPHPTSFSSADYMREPPPRRTPVDLHSVLTRRLRMEAASRLHSPAEASTTQAQHSHSQGETDGFNNALDVLRRDGLSTHRRRMLVNSFNEQGRTQSGSSHAEQAPHDNNTRTGTSSNWGDIPGAARESHAALIYRRTYEHPLAAAARRSASTAGPSSNDNPAGSSIPAGPRRRVSPTRGHPSIDARPVGYSTRFGVTSAAQFIRYPHHHPEDFHSSSAHGPRRDYDRTGFAAAFNRRRVRGFTLEDFMRDEDLDTSYEGLISLAATLGDVKPRATPDHVVAGLDTAFYKDWATPDSDQRCPICLDDYKSLDTMLKLPDCSHWLHKDCLEQWLKGASTCPVCRKSVKGSTPRRPPHIHRHHHHQHVHSNLPGPIPLPRRNSSAGDSGSSTEANNASAPGSAGGSSSGPRDDEGAPGARSSAWRYTQSHHYHGGSGSSRR